MHFALAQTPGGRPTTVTTTAMPDGSPRTSAVPAPSVFLPRAEPSTSRSAGASSAGTSTGPDADGPTDGDCDFGGSMMDDDYDLSSEDEYERSGSTFTIAVGMYSFERNLIETPYIHLSSKPVIEYVNLKFVENNFRTLGIDRVFDKNNIMRAELEFESFEVWFSHVKEYAIERDCIRDLRLPLFCHLYLNLYAPHNHARLHQFLKAFQYIFTSPRGSVYLDELRKVTDILDLSPRLAYFRRNKFVYGVSPMFLNNLYNFFQFNYMLQLVFQEWFDINYIAYEDPKVVFEDYYTNRLVRVNNLVKANAPKINNNVNTLRTVLWKKTLNSSQNQNNRKVNNYENEVTNNRKKSRKHRKKHKSRGKKKSTPDCLQESSNDTSNNEEQLRKKIKSSYRKKSTSDPDSRLCEESSEVSINEEKKYKRQKKSGRSKSTNDDNNTQTNESSSEVSNEEKKMHKRQKKSIKSKSISDVDMHSGLSDISNDDEKTQKLQNKRSKTQSTIDDNNHTISEDEESPIKDKKNYKSNDRRKYEHIDKDSTLSDSYSAEDSLEDSSSLYSTCDEEIEMRKYVRNNKKSAQRLRYETSRRLKHMKITKIDYKNLDEDLDLSLSRKIILKNCSKVSCSILTIDQNLVIAGSIDSLIYLWERDNKKSESDRTYNLHNIENINPSNSSSSVQGNDFIEYLDKSTAFVLRGHSGPIFDLAELPSAKILVSASNDKTYRAWDMVSKRCLEVYNEHEHRTWCIAACPYSLQVATGSCEGASCLWFLNYKRPLRIFMGHLDDILVLKFHPNQVLLATGSSDKTIRVFELTTGECHRVLIGHSDYITCLEFNVENANYLASASGSGEIVVWDVPTGEIVWKIRVGNVFFTDLAWLNADILLVSLTSGVVLKCDTTLNYLESSCKVIGFDTPFDRLISLKMINNIVYTIGIPDKSGSLKPMPKRNREKASQMKSEQRKSQRELSPLSKLFFPQHIIDNNGNSKRPLRGLSSTIPNPTYNFEYQINNDQLKKSTLPNFLSMNLRSAPFNLTAEEISKLSSEYQSENIRLIPAVTITNNLQNAYLLPVQPNVRTSNSNSTNLHPTNVQLPSTSKSQKLNKTQGPSKSKITTAKQHNFGNSSLTMHTSIQHMQIKTTTAQEQLHLDDHRDTNMLVQQYLQTTSTNTHKQQTSNLLQVTHPGMSSQVLQNSIVQQDQQVQLQHDVGSNSNLAGTNVQQQQLIQNLQSNTNLTKGNVQQRLSPQTNNRSSNTNVTKRSAPRKSPNK